MANSTSVLGYYPMGNVFFFYGARVCASDAEKRARLKKDGTSSHEKQSLNGRRVSGRECGTCSIRSVVSRCGFVSLLSFFSKLSPNLEYFSHIYNP